MKSCSGRLNRSCRHWPLSTGTTLRDHDHAQMEIRVYAQAMAKLIEPIVPVTMKVFKGSASDGA